MHLLRGAKFIKYLLLMETKLHAIPSEEYHADTNRMTSGGLRHIHRSPVHYWANYLDPGRIIKPPTQSMLLGTYVHCAVLEPDRFAHKYVGLDDKEICNRLESGGLRNPRTSKEYRNWLEDFKQSNTGKGIISADEYSKVLAMRDSVLSFSKATRLLDDVQTEKTIFFTHSDSGAICKAKIDAINTTSISTPIIIELKTCENASPEAFGKQVYNLRYYNQAAFYVDGFIAAGLSQQIPLHVFIAVENSPPYACAVYYTTNEILELGSRENAIDLNIYVNCLNTGVWYGYSNAIMPLQFPPWAFRNF